MTNYREDILSAALRLAEKTGGQINETKNYVDVGGAGVSIRIRWRLDWSFGIFIRFFRPGPDPKRKLTECGLCWLVKYANGGPPDVKNAVSNRIAEVMDVVERYGLKYLLGQVDDFTRVEMYAAEKAAVAAVESVKNANRKA
jgi:hypothetical protein